MAHGAKLGTGYIEIDADFSRFDAAVGRKLSESLAPHLRKAGEQAGKDMAKGLERSSFREALAPLVQRFRRAGDDAGKALASKVGQGSKSAQGDMFGLAGAVAEAEKRMRAAGKGATNFSADTFGIGRAAKSAGRDLRSVSTQLADWHTRAAAARKDTKALASGMRGLGNDLRRVVRAGFSGLKDYGEGVVGRLKQTFQRLGSFLRALKLPIIFGGLGLLTQMLSALTAGVVATTSAIGPLSGALVALPAYALTAAQAFGVLKLATAGIGDAVKAAFALQAKGGTQAISTLRSQEDATERVADAERNLADVHRQVQRAQEALTEARKAARRELEDLRLAAEGAHDSEQEGNLSLIQARRELAKTLRDPSASGLDIRFAEEAVDQARNSLKQTQVDAKRARADYAEAQKKGVEKLPQIVSAKESLADANRSVAAGDRELTKALRDQADAMKEQGSAANALQEKLALLPPAARTFVHFLIGLKPRLDALRQTAAKGLFPGVTAGIKSALGNFGVFQKIIGGTAKVMGGLAAKVGKLVGSKAWGKDLARIGAVNQRILGRMGDSALNLAGALRNILVAAGPFLEWLSESSKGLTEWLKGEAEAGRKSGALAEFFDETRKTMELLKPILTGVGGALLNIAKAARPVGNEILKALGGAAQGWKDWSGSVKGQNELQKYFADSKPAIFEAGRLVRDLFKAFFQLGHQKGVVELLHLVRTKLIPALTDVTGAITGWLGSFIREFGDLRQKGVPTFEAFLQTLANRAGDAAGKIAGIFVRTFLGASIWGKLAIAGWLLSKFGGLKALGDLGAKMGAKYGKRFLEAAMKWILGTEVGEGLAGRLGGAAGAGGTIGKASTGAGGLAGRLFGIGFTAAAVAALALAGAAIAEAIKKYVKPQIQGAYEQILGPAGGALNDVTNFIGKNLPEGLPGSSIVRHIFGGDTLGVIDSGTQKIVGKVGEARKGVIREFEQMRKGSKEHLDALPGIAERAGRGVNHQLIPRLGTLVDEGSKKGGEFNRGVSSGFQNLAGNVGSAIKSIMENTGRALGKLGAKKAIEKFAIKHPDFVYSTKTSPNLANRQRGGPVSAGLATGGLASIVPGNSTGDRHTLSLNGVPVAKVESREGIFVGNRKLMATMARENARVPRFQSGGFVGKVKGLQRGGLAEPMLDGPAGALKQLGKSAIHKVFEGAKDYLAKNRPVNGAGGPTGAGGPVPAGTVREWLTEALKITGHFSAANLSALYGRAMQESGGNPHAINLWDSNAAEGHPSKGLLQTIPETFASYKMRGHGDIWNPVDNAIAAIRYMFARYGHIVGPSSTGYMRGGLLKLAAGGMPDTRPVALRWSGVGPAGLHSGIRNLAAYVMEKFPGLSVSSTTGGEHAPDSYHYKGQAVDLEHGSEYSYLDKAAEWIKSTGLYRALAEGIHNPNLSVDEGRLVDPSFYSEVWAEHRNHIHLAVSKPWTAAGMEAAAGGPGKAGEAAKPPAEKVPSNYKGAQTEPLSFGAMPKGEEQIKKEIERLQGKMLPTYRSARASAEKAGKQGTAQAIAANVSRIEARLNGLRQARLRERIATVKKHLGKKLKRATNQFGEYDLRIAGAERDYNMASQDAEQLVGLEPQPPELPPQAKGESDKAYSDRQEAAEKAYANDYAAYVDGMERGAFGTALQRLSDWRNTVLRAETFGFGKGEPSVLTRMTGWEGEDFNVRQRIAQINDFTQEVAKQVAAFRADHPKTAFPDWLQSLIATRDRMREQLPPLRIKDSKLTEAIAEARGRFYPGGNRIKPPDRPLPGSGTLEEGLETIQGTHWPDEFHHSLIDLLPAKREAGKFGGIVWDLQETIEGLSLKVGQVANGVGGASGGSGEDTGKTEREQLLEQLLTAANQEKLVRAIEEKVFGERAKYTPALQLGGLVKPDLLPKYHSGGVITPGPFGGQEVPIMALAGERVRTPEQELEMAAAIRDLSSPSSQAPAGAPHVEVNINERTGEVKVKVDDREIEAVVNRMQQRGAYSAARRRAVIPR